MNDKEKAAAWERYHDRRDLERLHYDVFVAAVTGFSARPFIRGTAGDIQWLNIAEEAQRVALEAVRQWPAICAERDAAIREVAA